MEPLPLKTRRLYASLFFILFIIILPIAGLYASGYRLEGFALVPTGGIHLSTPASGFVISINGEEVDRSSLFSRSFFFDNLPPGPYVVAVASDEFYPWSKNVLVESRVVTDLSSVAIRNPLIVRELVVATSSLSTLDAATSTVRRIPRDTFTSIVSVFAATTTATSTTQELVPSAESGGVSLLLVGGDVWVRWDRSSTPPSSFCTRPSSCVTTFALERGVETVTDAQFFASGVVYRTRESGVYFSEIDVRSPRFTIPVFTAPNTMFEIINGTLYIESDASYFEVEGF